MAGNLETKSSVTSKKKYKFYFLIAAVFIVLAAIIFIMADGLKRWYSGGFFLIMGGVAMSKAIYECRKAE